MIMQILKGFKAIGAAFRRPNHLTLANSHGVTTWSPLGVAFNCKQSAKLNFSLNENTGLFGLPELTDPNGFYLLKERAMYEAELLIKEATSTSRKRKMVEIFDQLSDTLCKVADLAEFVRVAHPNPAFASAAENACLSISALVEKLNTNIDIYGCLKKVLEDGDVVPVDDVDTHVASLFLFDFDQSGISLNEAKRERVVALNEHILHVGNYFMQGTLKPNSVPKTLIPESLHHFFTVEDDHVLVTSLCSDSSVILAREAAYKIFLYPRPHQEELLHELLASRNELAQLVGFPTYSHRALNGTMVKSPEICMQFLESLSDKLHERAQVDFKAVAAMKNKMSQSNSQEVKPWDMPYFTYLIKRENFNINIPQILPYFSLGACMEGLNNIFTTLFGVSLIPSPTEHGEIWSPDVHKLAVMHEKKGLLGYIYCDFYERKGKPNQDCHFTIRGGRRLPDGTYQLPVVVLLLNFPSPGISVPSCLTPGMMENLFHEMGHAMHSMLARTHYQHVTGTRCSTDFAEVPSILMEYFTADPRVIATFARHFKDGSLMNAEEIKKVCGAKQVFQASEMQLQVFYSILDQVLHGRHPLDKNNMELLEDIQNKHYGLAHIAGTAWHQRFGHLVGYGAKYYSYLWSRAVASCIWQQCFKKDPFNSTMGGRYSEELLAYGGSRPAMELVQGFLHQKIGPEDLVQSLLNEIQDSVQLSHNLAKTQPN